MKITKQHLIYLKSLVLSQLLLESVDELANTNLYKQNTKNLLNKTYKVLEENVNEDFSSIYDNDPETMTNVMRSITELLGKVTTFDIDSLVMVNAIIDKYNENEEWFKEYSNAEFLRLDS